MCVRVCVIVCVCVRERVCVFESVCYSVSVRVPTLLESTGKYLNFRHMDSRPGKYLKTNIGP